MYKLDPEAPLYYRFVLQNHSFRWFFWLLHIADRANFKVTQRRKKKVEEEKKKEERRR